MPGESIPALLVSHTVALQPGGGGVQRCSREYCDALRAAGFDLRMEIFSLDGSLSARVRRRITPAPHRHFLPAGLARRCLQAADTAGTNLIFLNHSETGPLAAELHALSPQPLHIVMLSHGLDSTDFLHEADISGASDRRPRRTASALGRLLFTEMRERPEFAAVFCLSEVDLQIEHWLGTRRACLLPRIVEDRPLPWRPVPGRMGTVSTLDHPPNWDGLVRFCEALAAAGAADVRLRVVGGPAERGRALAAAHAGVEYLGPFDDAQLAAEAATWAVFVNPIFRYARGCSTKLAQPLSWRLPAATTRAGARGYRWDETVVPLANDAAELARLALPLARSPGPASRAAVERIAAASPRLADIALLIRSTLAPFGIPGPTTPGLR